MNLEKPNFANKFPRLNVSIYCYLYWKNVFNLLLLLVIPLKSSSNDKTNFYKFS